jgi:trehalose-6-phosphate synthase
VKALYVAADVALIASVREGVNLWAMEYVACRSRRPAHASMSRRRRRYTRRPGS